MGIIQFPMRKGWKRVHRLVVLPDYQGVGIGTVFQDNITERYISNGFNVNCTTTTPALVHTLKRSDKWSLVRFGRMKSAWKGFNVYGTSNDKKHLASQNHLLKTLSNNRVTYSFNFIGNKTEH